MSTPLLLQWGKAAQNMIEYHTTLMESNPDYWCPRQFHSEDNPKAHINTTGPEIWEQTNGEVDTSWQVQAPAAQSAGLGSSFMARILTL